MPLHPLPNLLTLVLPNNLIQSFPSFYVTQQMFENETNKEICMIDTPLFIFNLIKCVRISVCWFYFWFQHVIKLMIMVLVQ